MLTAVKGGMALMRRKGECAGMLDSIVLPMRTRFAAGRIPLELTRAMAYPDLFALSPLFLFILAMAGATALMRRKGEITMVPDFRVLLRIRFVTLN